MRSPFFCIVVCLGLGIIVASWVRIPFWAVWSTAVFCCFLCVFMISKDWSSKVKLAPSILLFCAVFFCGGACMINGDAQPANHIRGLVTEAMGNQCVASGRVASEPEETSFRTTFNLKTERLVIGTHSYGCSGVLLVVVSGQAHLEYGQAVEARGVLGLASGFRGLRRTSIRDYLKQKGIYAVLRIRSASYIRLIRSQGQPDFIALSLRMKKKFQEKIHLHMSPLSAGIMEAMLLGDKNDIPRFVYDDMIKSGTVHILVVSGFNVGIIAGICALLLKILRLNRMIRLMIIVPTLVFYCLMTGACAPVVRATVMGIFFFLSWYVRRDPNILQALSLSAFAILIFCPRELYDASFQLSFVAVLAICSLSPRIEKLVCADKICVRPIRWVVGLSIVSFSAWLGTVGFIVYYFRIFSSITVFANIFIPVIASFITLCGVALVVVEFLCPYVVNSFASVCEFLIVFLLRFNGFLIHIPGAYTRFP